MSDGDLQHSPAASSISAANAHRLTPGLPFPKSTTPTDEQIHEFDRLRAAAIAARDPYLRAKREFDEATAALSAFRANLFDSDGVAS
jgi:hypothetical protein